MTKIMMMIMTKGAMRLKNSLKSFINQYRGSIQGVKSTTENI
jgi:hypothetical protein